MRFVAMSFLAMRLVAMLGLSMPRFAVPLLAVACVAMSAAVPAPMAGRCLMRRSLRLRDAPSNEFGLFVIRVRDFEQLLLQ